MPSISVARSTTSKQAELEQARSAALAEVELLIGETRARYITTTPGQDAIYAAKEAEARDFLAQSPTPTDLTPYPFLAAEVGITAPDASSLALLWVQLADQWRRVGAQLEQLRIGTKTAIKAAPTPAAVQAELDLLKSTLGAL